MKREVAPVSTSPAQVVSSGVDSKKTDDSPKQRLGRKNIKGGIPQGYSVSCPLCDGTHPVKKDVKGSLYSVCNTWYDTAESKERHGRVALITRVVYVGKDGRKFLEKNRVDERVVAKDGRAGRPNNSSESEEDRSGFDMLWKELKGTNYVKE